jgi:hypothetical protein
MEKGLEELGRGRGREQEGTKAGSNELAGARTKEAWGTLAEAGAGAGKSNDLAGAMEKGLEKLGRGRGTERGRDYVAGSNELAGAD